MLGVLLILLNSEDTSRIYYLPQERVSAVKENFRREWDLPSLIQTRYYSTLPIPMGSLTRMLYLTGGVGPADYGYSVRGGAFWENRIIVNGIPLPDPIFHLIIMAPIEQEAVNYMTLYRSTLPIRYQGTSSLLKIETDRKKGYVRAGFPSASLQIPFDNAYFYAYGEWIPFQEFSSASIMMGTDNADAIAYIRRFSIFTTPTDTTYEDIDLIQGQTGVSLRPLNWINATLSLHHTLIWDDRDSDRADGSLLTSGISMDRSGWGCSARGMVRRGELSDMGSEFSRSGYRMGCYVGRESGIRLDVMNGEWKISARLFRKFFIGNKTALKLYIGNGYQILYIHPLILEPVILRRATGVYTVVAGLERLIQKGYADLNLYAKYYHPYTAPITDSMSRKYVVGMDFTVSSEGVQMSGFLQTGNIPGTARWSLNFAQLDRQGKGGVILGMRDGILSTDGTRGRSVGFAGISRAISIKKAVLLMGFVFYTYLPFGKGDVQYISSSDFSMPVIWIKMLF